MVGALLALAGSAGGLAASDERRHQPEYIEGSATTARRVLRTTSSSCSTAARHPSYSTACPSSTRAPRHRNLGANADQLTELSGTIQPGKYVAHPRELAARTRATSRRSADQPIRRRRRSSTATTRYVTAAGLQPRSAPARPALGESSTSSAMGNATFFEGTAAAPTLNAHHVGDPGPATAARTTDDNAADFAALSPPAPRNSATAAFVCGRRRRPTRRGVGAATPARSWRAASTLLTVAVTPGANPTSTGISVTGDLSQIGGSATQTFFDDGTNGDAAAGNNVFSYGATVAAATTPGAKSLPVGDHRRPGSGPARPRSRSRSRSRRLRRSRSARSRARRTSRRTGRRRR